MAERMLTKRSASGAGWGLVVASCFALCACAGGPDAPAAAGADTKLIGRVVESREVAYFVGDVAVEGYVHVVEQRGDPGRLTKVFAEGSACPVPGDEGRSYEMTVRQRRMFYGITDGESRKWTPDLAVSTCTPVE